jgi:hypothetical protein
MGDNEARYEMLPSGMTDANARYGDFFYTRRYNLFSYRHTVAHTCTPYPQPEAGVRNIILLNGLYCRVHADSAQAYFSMISGLETHIILIMIIALLVGYSRRYSQLLSIHS